MSGETINEIAMQGEAIGVRHYMMSEPWATICGVLLCLAALGIVALAWVFVIYLIGEMRDKK